MAKTISDENLKKTSDFIKANVEPRIVKIVEEVNAFFKKKGIRVGAEITWYFDELDESESEDES